MNPKRNATRFGTLQTIIVSSTPALVIEMLGYTQLRAGARGVLPLARDEHHRARIRCYEPAMLDAIGIVSSDVHQSGALAPPTVGTTVCGSTDSSASNFVKRVTPTTTKLRCRTAYAY